MLRSFQRSASPLWCTRLVTIGMCLSKVNDVIRGCGCCLGTKWNSRSSLSHSWDAPSRWQTLKLRADPPRVVASAVLAFVSAVANAGNDRRRAGSSYAGRSVGSRHPRHYGSTGRHSPGAVGLNCRPSKDRRKNCLTAPCSAGPKAGCSAMTPMAVYAASEMMRLIVHSNEYLASMRRVGQSSPASKSARPK